MSDKKHELLTLREHLSYPRSPRFFWWVPCCSSFRFLCCVFRYDFHIKRCSVRLYIQLFVGRRMSYLRYLCLFAQSFQHIWCCVFILLFFVVCVPYVAGFSLHYLFLIAPSILSNVYFLFSKNISDKIDLPVLGENIKFLILFFLWGQCFSCF